MKITNKHDLPAPIVRAVERHEHVGADYSATQLLKSPRQLLLERRHNESLERDVSEMIWSLYGTMLHYLLENGEGDHQFSETYMTEEVNGKIVSGTADLYDPETHTITDYKTTSTWTIVYGSRKKEWTQQLNIYAWLMRRAGFDVNNLEVVAILRDWSATKAKFDQGYPASQVVRVPLELWDDADADWFIKSRVEAFESVKDVPDVDLPYCTDEERWKSPDKFAVMKDGRKSAVKLHDDLNSAENHATQLGPNHYVEQRLGEPRRCKDYCPVAHLCNQYQQEISI